MEVGMVHCSEQLENLSVEIIGKSLEKERMMSMLKRAMEDTRMLKDERFRML